jgi:hypothetical protein
VGGDVGQARLFTDAIQHAHHADKMALAPVGREEKGRFRLRLFEQQINGGAPDHARLRAALGVREPDRFLFLVEPCPFQPQGFHAPETGEQQEADGGKPGWVLALLRDGAKCLAQALDLGATEPPFSGLGGQFSDSLGRIGFDLSEAHGMLEDGVQGRNGSRRDPFAAGGGAATAADASLRCLAGRDIRLRAFDVAELEGADLPPAKQRFDVRLNPAAIHRQRGCLDGASAAAKDAAGFCFGDVPVADLGDGQESGRLGLLGDRIDTLGHGDQLLMGKRAGFLDGHQAIAPDHHPPQASLGCAILDHEALETRRHDLHAEAAKLAIPQETLPNLDPNLRRFRSLQGVDDALGDSFPSHFNHLLDICLEWPHHTIDRS